MAKVFGTIVIYGVQCEQSKGVGYVLLRLCDECPALPACIYYLYSIAREEESVVCAFNFRFLINES